jgi:hypothetical protein
MTDLQASAPQGGTQRNPQRSKSLDLHLCPDELTAEGLQNNSLNEELRIDNFTVAEDYFSQDIDYCA